MSTDDRRNMNEQDVTEALAALITGVEESQLAGFALLADRQARLLARRRAVADRLTPALPEDDPVRQATETRARRAEDLELAFRRRTKRLAKQPRLSPDQWIVSGHVRHASGKPATRLVVQVYDADRRYDDLLGTTETDDFGDFRLTYDVASFRDEMGDELPDLYVLVADRKGNDLVVYSTPIRCEAGREEHFDITLPTG